MNIKNLLENKSISVFIANEYMANIQPWSVSAGGNAPVILEVLERDIADGKKIIDSYNQGEYNLPI